MAGGSPIYGNWEGQRSVELATENVGPNVTVT